MITEMDFEMTSDDQSADSGTHKPVMVEEVFKFANLTPGDIYVDGTLGLGGHALEAWKRIGPNGRIIGFDWDEQMLAWARENLDRVAGIHYSSYHADFREMSGMLDGLNVLANAVLLDLGLNSAQVDDASRGFSFQEDGPLDMRMDRTRGEPVAALVNRLSPFELESVLFEYGDERWARAIAKEIVAQRKVKPLRRTSDIVDAVLKAVPPRKREKRIHPATRTFQALRIVVNGELNGLREALLEIPLRLASGGVLCVLSYHSGEDRIVKGAFRELSSEGFEELTPKPLTPTEAEISINRRSRSARLRVLKRRNTAGLMKG